MDWTDILFYFFAIALIVSMIYVGWQMYQTSERTSDLCQKAGYEMGSYNAVEGYECLKEECNTINNVKTCKDTWIKFTSIEEVR